MVSRKHKDVLERILSGRSDANIGFTDLKSLLQVLGFSERIQGGHHIFSKEGVEEIVNLQPKGSKAKPYQVKQIRGIITRYKMGFENE
jgi:hypothetical protein